MLALARVVRARVLNLKAQAHVFLSFHLPLADLRSFIPNSGKLIQPDWPFTFRGFVRGFGSIKVRRRGGVPDFIGEDILCDARGALQLESGQITYGNKRAKFICKHRRLFHDGLCFTRFDIGFVSGRTSLLSAAQTECALYGLLTTQARAAQAKDSLSPRKTVQLQNVGHQLAGTYLRSTTFSQLKSTTSPHWVMPGRPLVLLEYKKSQREYAHPPSHAKRIALPPNTGLDVHFILLNAGGIEVPAWIFAALPNANQRVLRDIRLMVTRMHAESECLARVLSGVANRSIAPPRGSATSDNLQRYLRDSIKRLEKIHKRRKEYFNGTELVDFAATALEDAQRGRSSALCNQAVEQLSKLDVRPSIIEAAAKAQTLINIENLHMSGDNLSNSNKTVISGSSIGSISDSFNNAIGKTEIDELKSGLAELKVHVELLCKAASAEKAQEIAKHFDKFTKEATDSKPDKSYLAVSARGLIDAANALSMLVAPISAVMDKIVAIVCS